MLSPAVWGGTVRRWRRIFLALSILATLAVAAAGCTGGNAPGEGMTAGELRLLESLPRYQGAQQLEVVRAGDQGQERFRVRYTVSAPVKTVEQFYRREMGRLGWRAAEAGPAGSSGRRFVFERPGDRGRPVSVVVGLRAVEGGKTEVTVTLVPGGVAGGS